MSIKPIVYKIIERLLSLTTDKIVCISMAEYQSAVRTGIDGERKLNVIENGINVKAVEEAKVFERKLLGIPEDAYVIGMVGRLTSQKAPDIFIRAAKLIVQKIPNTYYIIVGNGEQEEDIKKYAKENDISLLITGWTDQPYAYMKLFDVAMLLSRWEGFGLAIIEYMAAEKNIVASRIDAIPTIVDDGIDGLLVDVDAPEEVADKVYYYYTHQKEAKAMIHQAKKKVKERFDISRVVRQHKEMFNLLMKE